MTAQALWLPGEFPTTNELLDRTRASGYYAGKQVAEKRRPRRNEQDVNAIVRTIRGDVKLRALSARLVRVAKPVQLLFLHLGSGRADPSAWYLTAKAIEDGLVDAGVLGSDRFDVVATSGACRENTQHWRDVVERLTSQRPTAIGGVLVMVGVPDGFAWC